MVQSIDRPKLDTRAIIDRTIEELQGYLDYYKFTQENYEPGWPSWPQSMRIKAFVEKKRILVADDPGIVGKTFDGFAGKIELEKRTGKRTRALVISPNSGVLNAWSQSEMDLYTAKMRYDRRQVVRPIREFSDLDDLVDADFTVVNWEKLSIPEDGWKWTAFEKFLARYSPDVFIFDECHNAKTSSSLRGKSLSRLVKYTEDRHVLLLSATPIPNRYRDLGMVFHMLDPKTYDDPRAIVKLPPEIIRELLNRQVWFRLTYEDMKEPLGLPDFVEKTIPVQMTKTEAEAYHAAWRDCTFIGRGLTDLQLASIDARLTKYYKGPDIMPSKIRAVRENANAAVESGNRVIVKTRFVAGILNQLYDVLQADRITGLVDAGMSLEERRKVYAQFRNGDIEILLTSDVSGESVDLTTGSVPVTHLHVQPEMCPGPYIQWRGRSLRRGQQRDGTVTIAELVSVSDYAQELQIRDLDEIVQLYNIRRPRNFKPRTIESDMVLLRRAKQAVIDKIYSGRNITSIEEALHDADGEKIRTHLSSMPSMAGFSAFRQATIMQAAWRGIGEAEYERLTKTSLFKENWILKYEEGWEQNGRASASKKTLQNIGQLIDFYELTLGHEPVIVDVGAGAAYFSRATGRKTICVDLSREFMELGASKSPVENEYIVGRATDTGLPENSADIVICSYVLMYNGKELEQCVTEANRLLKDGGKWMIALPYTIDKRQIKTFSDQIVPLGFREVEYYGVKQTKCDEMKAGCHIVVYEKFSDALPMGLELSLLLKTRLIH